MLDKAIERARDQATSSEGQCAEEHAQLAAWLEELRQRRMDNGEDRDDGIKRMSVKSFVDFGFLQEVNRQVLHPCGVALEVTMDDSGRTWLSGVWDNREDPEGIMYVEGGLNSNKADRVRRLRESKREVREGVLDFEIQPVERS